MAINRFDNILRAILKDRVTDLIGEELYDALGGGELDKKIKAWLGEETTAQALEKASIEADHLFLARVADPVLKEWMTSLPLRTLPEVMEVLEALPEAPDESQLMDVLGKAIERRWENISAAQAEYALDLYLSCLGVTLVPLEVHALKILGFKIAEIEEKLRSQGEDFNRRLDELENQYKTKITALHQLPAAPADFVGRETELEQIIKNEHGAISGLSGMGGVGKTALGLVAADRLAGRYSDAQFFISMRGTTQAPLTPQEAMRQVILGFEPGANLRDYTDEQIKGFYLSLLNGKQALLFFDDAKDAAHVRPLLPPAGNAVLLTSRTRIHLEGMGEPLRLDVLHEEEAVKLLLEICPRLSQGDFAAQVAKLCGYLPLALRIAGTFLAEHRDWKVAEYIERLMKQRLKTLKAEDDPELGVEAAFELSYAILDEAHQKSWRALGVFTAPFSREALAAVCGLETEAARDFAGKFERLSLLDYDEKTERYKLHELLYEFAKTKLDVQQDFEAHLRHGTYYMQVAYQAKALYLLGGEHVLEGLRLFDRELAQLQAAQKWAAGHIQNGAAEMAMRLPNAGNFGLVLRLKARDQIDWLESGLKAARILENKKYEEYHLGNLGQAYSALGETPRAIEVIEQNLAIARAIGDRRGEGAALDNLGIVYNNLGESRRAIEYHEQSMEIDREIGDRRGEGNTLGNIGNAYKDMGETRRAIEFYEQVLEIMREIGDRRGEGNALGNLGNAYKDLGKTRRAIEFYEQRLVIAREIGDRRGEGNSSFNMGLACQELGEIERARQLGQQALEIFSVIEDPWAEQVRKWLEGL